MPNSIKHQRFGMVGQDGRHPKAPVCDKLGSEAQTPTFVTSWTFTLTNWLLINSIDVKKITSLNGGDFWYWSLSL